MRLGLDVGEMVTLDYSGLEYGIMADLAIAERGEVMVHDVFRNRGYSKVEKNRFIRNLLGKKVLIRDLTVDEVKRVISAVRDN